MAVEGHNPRVTAVLAGEASYDSLESEDQATVRVEWTARIEQGVANLNLQPYFAERGWSWVELDDDGLLVRRARPDSG